MSMRSDFLQQMLAAGRPVRASTASLVVRAGTRLTGRTPEMWDARDITELTWHGVTGWCRANGVDVPDDAAITVQRLADHLDPDGDRGLAAAVHELVG